MPRARTPKTLHQKTVARRSDSTGARPSDALIQCPFEIVADTREQHPYEFAGLRANASKSNALIVVKVHRLTLSTGQGDYSIFGLPSIGIERKSKADLYSSIAQHRDNFEKRLELMRDGLAPGGAHVVVEAQMDEILNDPPPHTKMNPRSLYRSIIAWQIRYPAVHWHFCPGRDVAEGLTFRLLERFWEDRHAIDKEILS